MDHNLLQLYNDGITEQLLPDIKGDFDIELSDDIANANRQEAPIPSPIELIIITCKTKLHCNLNFELIAKHIKLDDQVIGKRLYKIIDEGCIKKKIQKEKPASRGDFSNQCTLVIKPVGYENPLNLKVFGNGRVVITNNLSKKDGELAIKILKSSIRNLEAPYKIIHYDSDAKIGDIFNIYFDNISAYIKYISKNYLVFLKLFSIYIVNVDLKLAIVTNRKIQSKYLSSIIKMDTVISEGELINGTNSDLLNYIKLIQVYNVCKHYFPQETFLEKLENPKDPVHKLIDDLYNGLECILPVTFDMEGFDKPCEMTIANYNTMFNSKFHCDRERFTEILNKKYKETMGIIASAKFEPTNYQGINVKYVSRIECDKNCQSFGKKKISKCLCKEISFLIFQEGNVIITGGRSWNQILDGYDVIKNIMKNEFHNIVINCKSQKDFATNSTENTKDFPPQITHVENGTKLVYLNIRKQILENPRNYYILKKNNLIHLYNKH